MSYSAEVLADSPSAYWRLGESSGTTGNDSSGNGRNGTYAGGFTLGIASALAGDSNTAVDFNNTSARLSMSSAQQAAYRYDSPGGLSVGFWLKTTATGSANAFDASCCLLALNEDASNKRWVISINPSGQLAVTYGTNYRTFAGSVAINDGNWHHNMVTLAIGGSYTGKTYFDGALDFSSTSLTADAGSGTGLALRIGYNNRASVHVSPGVMDEVAIFQSVLSADRVTAHYLAGKYARSAIQITPAALQRAATR